MISTESSVSLLVIVFLCLIRDIHMDQGIFMRHLLTSRLHGVTMEWSPSDLEEESPSFELIDEDFEDHLIVGGLPGQPSNVNFKHYSGYLTVDKFHGRSLFYFFVEANRRPTSKPVILWLNGGPGCSSLGVGAMVENGPFGVKEDGRTLYLRHHSWNKLANMLYLESPAGVGFSYSNTSSDYITGDSRTAQDSYIFLVKWLKKFSHFKTSDFYIAGESYAGFYIPELADTILNKKDVHISSGIKLKGIMVGNGIMNEETDTIGMYDYLGTHALISEDTRKGLIDSCVGRTTPACVDFQNKMAYETGNVDLNSLWADPCSNLTTIHGVMDPCQKSYVSVYLNLPEVQNALHANRTLLPYPWGIGSLAINTAWADMPTTMYPIYRKLFDANLRILVYSGDADGTIPWTSTKYSIDRMNLTTKAPWKPWLDFNRQVGGYMVEYEGLTFATVRGAGHEVPRFQPERAFSLMKLFLEE